MKKADIEVIGGSGLENMLKGMEQIYVGTPYGIPPSLLVGDVCGIGVAFIPGPNVKPLNSSPQSKPPRQHLCSKANWS